MLIIFQTKRGPTFLFQAGRVPCDGLVPVVYSLSYLIRLLCATIFKNIVVYLLFVFLDYLVSAAYCS